MFLPFSARSKEWEPVAQELRNLLRLQAADQLDPWKLAPRVGLHVVDGDTAFASVGENERNHLLGPGRDRWSGGVYPTPLPDGTCICILNPSHSHQRNKITLMEEIVHTHRRHKPTGLRLDGNGVSVRGYDRGQEEEAYGIGAAALLPWSTFFHGLNGGRTAADLAEEYDVSPELVTYRIKVTGASSLYRSRQQRRA